MSTDGLITMAFIAGIGIGWLWMWAGVRVESIRREEQVKKFMEMMKQATPKCEICGSQETYRRTGWRLDDSGSPVPRSIWLCGECLKEDLKATIEEINGDQ